MLRYSPSGVSLAGPAALPPGILSGRPLADIRSGVTVALAGALDAPRGSPPPGSGRLPAAMRASSAESAQARGASSAPA
ncbi:hypothetical protein, partial [Paraburkholderia ribeironis]|uniref:hypothetical protein n=1 Tax=Paraburkholderia ribeironis TaxID=1247936 RepID=UPI001C3F7C74